ncbi:MULTISPECIES: SMI1/KNR4 family protein [Chromobacterium]|uniref:SMI1/KNR4 family protein n=1 Tax=Chromobacterium TaxID=535 RepID=UPI001D095A7D|nr:MULTISPECIES: SMI1/KNR4 family protein [Chromobacterium]MCP1293032.1 SMI1/KNR4 family protein [Chromobacterium sp. S0633]
MSFVEKIIAAGLSKGREIVGLSDMEVLEVESAQGVKLPMIYRGFLQECGKGAGLFERGADFFYPTIKSLKEELSEMLAEEGMDFCIPENAFVFSAYQGCQYCFFLCSGNQDPPVYKIDDGGGTAVIISDSFSQHVAKAISDYKRVFFHK